jgi:hypothetical protein
VDALVGVAASFGKAWREFLTDKKLRGTFLFWFLSWLVFCGSMATVYVLTEEPTIDIIYQTLFLATGLAVLSRINKTTWRTLLMMVILTIAYRFTLVSPWKIVFLLLWFVPYVISTWDYATWEAKYR